MGCDKLLSCQAVEHDTSMSVSCILKVVLVKNMKKCVRVPVISDFMAVHLHNAQLCIDYCFFFLKSLYILF